MSIFTVAECQEQLAAWKAASLAVANNQSYSIKDRSLTRANASEIREMIKYWSNELASAERKASGRGRTRYVVPE